MLLSDCNDACIYAQTYSAQSVLLSDLLYSLDSLALYCIRYTIVSGGWNNNPTCKEFRYVFRRLLVHTGIFSTSTGNVVPQDTTSLLPLDLRATSITSSDENDEADVLAPTQGVLHDHTYGHFISPMHTRFLENIVCYIAGFVVKAVMPVITCDVCRSCLIADAPQSTTRYWLLQLKDKGGLVIPSPGITELLMCAEKTLRRAQNVQSAKVVSPVHVMTNQVKREHGMLDTLGLGSHIIDTQHIIDNHYYNLIELLVTKYYNIRQRHVARLHTSNIRRKPTKRQKLTKLILFSGD